jgi:type IX secretion system PorP/SprF family membrane protein
MKKISAILLFMLISRGFFSQDLEFTQFYSNPLYLNPAFAGSHGCPRFAMNYRNQWPSLTGTYVSYAAAYDQFFSSIHGGFGVVLVNDVQAKTINTFTGSLVYSYHLQLNKKWHMYFGAKATWQEKSLAWEKLTFNDQIDPKKGFVKQTKDVPRGGSHGFFDATAGFIISSKTFNFGVAGNHLNTPYESMIIGPQTDDNKLPIRITAHTNANIVLGKYSKYNGATSIMPSIIYSYQNGFSQLNIGTYVKYGNMQFGTWFRNRDALILTVGINTGTFKVGYSYDVTVSRLNNGISGGSHEVSLGFNLNCKPKPKKFRTISCPSF